MTSPPPPDRGFRWASSFGWLVLSLCAITLAGAHGLLGSFFAETLIHWTAHLTLVVLLAMVLLRSSRIGSVLACGLLLAACWPGASAAWRGRAPELTKIRTLRAAVANVHIHNSEPISQVLNSLTDCDLVALIEVDASDRAAVTGDSRWPHQYWSLEPAQRFGGVALLSRLPLNHGSYVALDGDPALECGTGSTASDSLYLIVAHPRAPVSDQWIEQRDRQIAGIVQRTVGAKRVLVLADWNCSPLSPAWGVLDGAGLRGPAGLALRSWPSWLGPCGIAIDHILGSGVAMRAVETRSIAGSDHRAVVVDIGW